MLDVFVREAFAVGALREAHAFAKRAVVGFGVGRVQDGDGMAAGDAYWHFRRCWIGSHDDCWAVFVWGDRAIVRWKDEGVGKLFGM